MTEDHRDVIVSEYESGKTLQEVADLIGRSVSFVHGRLIKAGVPRRRQGPYPKNGYKTKPQPKPQRPDLPDSIADEYLAGSSKKSIAAKYGETEYMVTKRLNELGVPNGKDMTESDRFWRQVNKSGPFPTEPYRPVEGRCWTWTGNTNSYGYGMFGLHELTESGRSQKRVMAHRYAYEELVGEITEDTLGNLCLNKLCVNPDHLEPCSVAENTKRGREVSEMCKNGIHTSEFGQTQCQPCLEDSRRRRYDRRLKREGKRRVGHGYNRLKTHCPKGHLYSEENTYVDNRGYRSCRECVTKQERARYLKRKISVSQ